MKILLTFAMVTLTIFKSIAGPCVVVVGGTTYTSYKFNQESSLCSDWAAKLNKLK